MFPRSPESTGLPKGRLLQHPCCVVAFERPAALRAPYPGPTATYIKAFVFDEPYWLTQVLFACID